MPSGPPCVLCSAVYTQVPGHPSQRTGIQRHEAVRDDVFVGQNLSDVQRRYTVEGSAAVVTSLASVPCGGDEFRLSARIFARAGARRWPALHLQFTANFGVNP